MQSTLTSLVGFVPFFCALYLLFELFRFGSRDKRLPPGPPTVPILGNAHLIPAHGFHEKLKEWSDKYGPIFSLKIGRGTLIVLNDRRAVHDLIDKRSAIYSDRPMDEQVETALSDNLAFLPANHVWRAQRKIASQLLAPKSLDDKIAPIQEAEISQLVHDILSTPDDFYSHIKRTTASIASIVIFGFRARSSNSFWAAAVYKVVETINSAIEPGSYLPVAQFPILRYIPDRWNPGKARAKQCNQTTTSIWTEACQRIEKRRKDGVERPSLADKYFSGELKPDVAMSSSQFANFCGTLHGGASDTTASAMLTNILHLAKYPWVQDKATDELDRICGADRAPTWADFKDLPYINCIIKEGLRIRPVAPSGIPHRAARDDWFDGMLIPKDATVFFPPHTLHHIGYTNPEIYNPDRFTDHPRLAMDYAGSSNYQNRDHYAYGGGRRICVGIHLAERTQWRITAKLLWAFRILPALDEDGKEIKLDIGAYTDGLVTEPMPYRVRFVPRSERHVEVINKDFEDVREFLAQWEEREEKEE